MKIDGKQKQPWLVMELKKMSKYSDMHSIVHCCIMPLFSFPKRKTTILWWISAIQEILPSDGSKASVAFCTIISEPPYLLWTCPNSKVMTTIPPKQILKVYSSVHSYKFQPKTKILAKIFPSGYWPIIQNFQISSKIFRSGIYNWALSQQ